MGAAEARPGWLRFLLVCPRVCSGSSSKKRRAVRSLRRARSQCVQLQRDPALAESLPIEHLRAAEHHLAALERWLAGNGPHGFDDLKLLMAELGSAGPAHEEEEEMFEELFFASEGEVLVKALPCLAKSGSLHIPGKLYISSSRLCFHAVVLGAVASLACPWQDVSQVRLVSQDSVKTHPVQVCLKKVHDFAGAEVMQIRIRLFDVEGLGQFDKCATYFTGAGLFGLSQSQSTGWDPTASSGSFSGRSRTSKLFMRQRSPSASPTFGQSQLEGDCTVWELERRVTIWHETWHSPFLPHDGQKKQRWMVIKDRGYLPHPSLPKASRASPAEWSAPPISSVEFLGQERACSWQTVVDVNSDEQGWQYAVDFYFDPEQWTPYCCGFSHVRRRKWRPTFGPHALSRQESGGMRSSRLRLSRSKSTLMLEKGLDSSETNVFEADIGLVSLEALGQALEADDWCGPGQLMALYFQELKAENLDVHEWTSLQGVKGKTRSVEMKVPVPPAPMCPAETRCHSTWHVSSSPSRVILESVTMSLDVPYGMSFNVVVCDTFTYKEGSRCVRMVRSCAVDWVSSIWLTSLVEQSVGQPSADMGERWASVLQRWARANEVPTDS